MLSIAYLALLQLSLAPFLSINASPVTLSTDNTTKSNSSDIIGTGQTSYPIDPDFNVAGARWLFGVCFGIMQLNAIGSIYVLYRTYIKWRGCGYKRNSLSMALRVPFYIAVSDLCLYAAHMANQGYTVINDRTWPGLSCKIVGGIVFFQVAANMTLVGAIALVTYLRVCRRIVIDFGPYDRNLFFSVLGFPLVLTLCSIPSFGPSTYWCYTNKTNHIMPIITLVLNFSIIALNVFCYFFTLRKINSSSNQLAIHVKDYVTRAANVERKVTRKIAAYVLIFSIQWTPAMPYVIASVISSSTPSIALYFLADVAINLGGIGNGIQYIINEGWSINNNDTSDFSASSTHGSAIASARPPFTTSVSPTDKSDEWELTSPNNHNVNDSTAIVVQYN